METTSAVMKHRTNTISFTPESFARFKRDHAYARAEGFDAFTFEGHEVLVEYAKYMIAYIQMQIGEKPD
jgi:hypothetical protein